MSVVEQEIPEGYKQTEVGVIPDDWECVTLGDLGDIVRGGSPRPAGDPKYFNGNYIPWLTVASLTNIPASKQEVTSTLTKLTELGSKQSRILDADTLIISNSGATLGVAKILGLKCCANDGVAAIINQKKGNKSFITHYINTQTKRLHDDVATGNGQPNLNTDLIKLIPIPFPSESEQTAIANALSDVDALLTELEKLSAKKQAIKTATMQQLLTGKTRLPQFAYKEVATYTEGALDDKSQGQPKHSSGTNVNVGACDDGSRSSNAGGGMDSRRKGTKPSELGEIPEGWDLLNIGNNAVLKARIGWQALTTKEYLDTGSKYLVTGTDFGAGEVNWNSCCFVSDWRYKQDTNIQLKENDVLITKDGTIGKVGFINDLPLPATLNSGVFVVRPKDKSFYPRYLFYVLTSSLFKSFIKGITAGSTITHLYQKDFVHFEFPAPDVEEQTAIATILSDMDNEIQTLEQRLAKTRQIKQGMMQELLTGRTRLLFDSTNGVNKEIENAN